MSNEAVIAYLAGAMDSDGCISVRRSTYAARHGEARHPVFSERLELKQVTPQIPELLKKTFGGSLMFQKPAAATRRPMYAWHATNRVAAEALRAMLPYLRVKQAQAENALALRASKDLPRSETHTHRAPELSRARWGDTRIRRLEVSPETLAHREDIYRRSRELNRVGA